jgi:hypothetical protein
MTLIAKPVVDKEYWIIKQNDQKVGNIQAVNDGYQITINNKIASYKTIPMLRNRENIEFEPAEKTSKQSDRQVHGYETSCRVFNPIWDVKHRLPLFTKEEKSKSWYAAGWYLVKQHRNWKPIHNPKLIVLERYAYQGPFYTREEANDKSVS